MEPDCLVDVCTIEVIVLTLWCSLFSL